MPSATAKKTPAKAAVKPAAKAAVKSATKPATKPAARSTAKPASSASAPAAAPQPITASLDTNTLRTRDLVARVAEATGAKAKDLRQAVEATLAELGKALDQGQTLQLPPLGKLMISPRKSDDATGPIKLKLRRATEPAQRKNSKKEALAEPDEAS